MQFIENMHDLMLPVALPLNVHLQVFQIFQKTKNVEEEKERPIKVQSITSTLLL